MTGSKVRTTRIPTTRTFARTLGGLTHQLLCKHWLRDIPIHSRLRQRLLPPRTVNIRLDIIPLNANDVRIAQVLMNPLSPGYNHLHSRYRHRTRPLVRPPAPGGPTRFIAISGWDLAQISGTM
jgi:hypothetical protein